uniref:Uncharacterized protein n=1 Tax=Panagrolaimus davidi TaxID=227884 RepID=A0A914P1E6_9BILA
MVHDALYQRAVQQRAVQFFSGTTLKDVMISSFKKDELLTLAMESVLFELIEKIIYQNEENLKADAEIHINALKCAIEYKGPTESSKMLRDTGKSLVEVLEYAQKNPDCDQKLKAAKAAAENNLKAYRKSIELDNIATTEKQKAQASLSQERQTIMQMRLANSKTAKERLENEKKTFAEYRKELAAKSDKLNEVVISLQTLDVKNANLEQILQYLHQGITQLVGVQSAWRKVVAFFRSIKLTVNGPLVYAIKGTATNIKKITDKEMICVNELQRKVLLREINKACAVAYVLMESAQLYKQISSKYIMPILDSSCRNIVMSDEEAQQKQHSIVDGFKRTKTEVKRVLDDYENKLEKRVSVLIKNQGFLNNLTIKE